MAAVARVAEAAAVLGMVRVLPLGLQLPTGERVVIGLCGGPLIAEHTYWIPLKDLRSKEVPMCPVIASLGGTPPSGFYGLMAALA